MKANKLVNMIAGIDGDNDILIDKLICRAINMGANNMIDIDREIAIDAEIAIENGQDEDYELIMEALE